MCNLVGEISEEEVLT